MGDHGSVSAERITDGPDEDRRYLWEQAALEAERETGRREETEDAARASLLVRACRITAGAVVLLVGLALLVLPGPGMVVIAGGLSVLAIDVPFARRLLHKVRRRLPQDADGGLPGWLVVAMSGSFVVAIAASAALLIV
jgi:hypothetical protein